MLDLGNAGGLFSCTRLKYIMEVGENIAIDLKSYFRYHWILIPVRNVWVRGTMN